MRNVIIGAGISGLTAARELQAVPGERTALFEQAFEPGGLCRVEERDGFHLDIVSHVLHFRNERARQYVADLMGDDLVSVTRSTSIYFRGRFVPYPFQSHMGFLPFRPKLECLSGYLRAWVHRRINGKVLPENFSEWARYHFGEGVARHFMIPYNREVWGVQPHEMSVDWVRSFIPHNSFGEAIRGLFVSHSESAGYNRKFLYPIRGGMKTFVERLSAGVRNIQCNRKVIEIDFDARMLRFEDGGSEPYDRLISTAPLDVLVERAKGIPDALRDIAGELRCSRILNIAIGLRGAIPHRYHWIYFPEPEYPFFRLVFPSNISQTLAPAFCSIINAEIANPDPGGFDELEEAVIRTLMEFKMVAKREDIVFVARNYLSHAYPVHDLRREKVVSELVRYLKSRNVHSIGRFGAWRYSSIDDAISGALETVAEIRSMPAQQGDSAAALETPDFDTSDRPQSPA